MDLSVKENRSKVVVKRTKITKFLQRYSLSRIYIQLSEQRIGTLIIESLGKLSFILEERKHLIIHVFKKFNIYFSKKKKPVHYFCYQLNSSQVEVAGSSPKNIVLKRLLEINCELNLKIN